MDLLKNFLVLLAIFCVLGSAAAVCAADDGGNYADYGGYAGSQYNDGIDDVGLADDFEYSDDGLTDRPIIDPDYAHTEAAGEPVNETGNVTSTAADNVTANATDNVTAPVVENATGNVTASHSMPVTGNPIVILLGVSAVLGGAYVITRKK